VLPLKFYLLSAAELHSAAARAAARKQPS